MFCYRKDVWFCVSSVREPAVTVHLTGLIFHTEAATTLATEPGELQAGATRGLKVHTSLNTLLYHLIAFNSFFFFLFLNVTFSMSWQAVFITRFVLFFFFVFVLENPILMRYVEVWDRARRRRSPDWPRTESCRRAAFDVWSQGDPSSWQTTFADCGRLSKCFNPLKQNSSGALKYWFGFFFFFHGQVLCVCVFDWALFTLNYSVLPQCVWRTQPTLAIHVQQFVFLNILWTVILSSTSCIIVSFIL